MSPKLLFGKYKGVEYRVIMENDPFYVEYLLNWDGLNAMTRKQLQHIYDNYHWGVFYFGKHKGLSLQDAFDEEEESLDYFIYLLELDDKTVENGKIRKIHPKFRKSMEEFVEKHLGAKPQKGA